jgi:hypothetical protein
MVKREFGRVRATISSSSRLRRTCRRLPAGPGRARYPGSAVRRYAGTTTGAQSQLSEGPKPPRAARRGVGPTKNPGERYCANGVETESTHSASIVGSDFEKAMIPGTPRGRLGQPEDIARVAPLASENSRGLPVSSSRQRVAVYAAGTSRDHGRVAASRSMGGNKGGELAGLGLRSQRTRRWSGHAQSEVTSDRLLGMAFTRGSFRISSLSAAMISSALRAFAIRPPEPLDEHSASRSSGPWRSGPSGVRACSPALARPSRPDG